MPSKTDLVLLIGRVRSLWSMCNWVLLLTPAVSGLRGSRASPSKPCVYPTFWCRTENSFLMWQKLRLDVYQRRIVLGKLDRLTFFLMASSLPRYSSCISPE